LSVRPSGAASHLDLSQRPAVLGLDEASLLLIRDLTATV
jgi:hypothetical protein